MLRGVNKKKDQPFIAIHTALWWDSYPIFFLMAKSYRTNTPVIMRVLCIVDWVFKPKHKIKKEKF